MSLTCQVERGTPPLTYNWNSTCDGLCFVPGKTAQYIEERAIHSKDGGNHTCSVTDYTGHTGNDTIQMIVTGMGAL